MSDKFPREPKRRREQQRVLKIMPTERYADIVANIARRGPFGTTKTRRIIHELCEFGLVRSKSLAMTSWSVGRYRAWYRAKTP